MSCRCPSSCSRTFVSANPRGTHPTVSRSLAPKRWNGCFKGAHGLHRRTLIPRVAGDVDSSVVVTPDTALRVSGQAQVVLDKYRAIIHEYRNHKEAVGSWLTQFTQEHKRTPSLLDAEATEDVVLISRFQQYLMMRKRLMAELPFLREQVREAQAADNPAAAPQASTSSSSSKKRKKKSYVNGNSSTAASGGALGLVNANVSSPRSASQAASQFFSALEYKRSHQLAPGAAAAAAGAETAGLGARAAAAGGLEAVTAAAATAGASEGMSASSVAATGAEAAASASTSTAGPFPAPAQGAAVAATAPKATAPAGLSGMLIERIRATGAAHNGATTQQLSGASAAQSAPTAVKSSGAAAAAAAADHVGNLVGTSSNSGGAPASRVSSAALSALEYKRQKAAGKAQPAAGIKAPTAAQLAPLLAPAPAPPPPLGAAAGGLSAAAATPGAQGMAAAVGAVETAKFDVYAHKKQVKVEEDMRMDVLLNGVAGGLGAQEPVSSAAASTSSSRSSSSSSSRGTSGYTPAVAAAEMKSSSSSGARSSSSNSSGVAGDGQSGQGAAVVITAKFDPYSGRRRKVEQEEGGLDEYLAGLAAASTALAVEQGLIDKQETQVKTIMTASSSSSSSTGSKDAGSSGRLNAGVEKGNESVAAAAWGLPSAVSGNASPGLNQKGTMQKQQQQQQPKGPGGGRPQQQQQQQQDALCDAMLPGEVLPVPT